MRSDDLLPDFKGKIGLTLGHLFAIGLCLARSYLRVKKDRVWWDDRMVLGAAALDAVYMLTLWIKPLYPQIEVHGVVYQNAWLLYFFGHAATCLSRVSLWISLARIYAPPHKTRRLAFVLATIFVVLGALSTLVSVLGCNESKWGTRLRVDRCYLNTQHLKTAPLYAKLSITVSFVYSLCDITLVVVPAYLLSNVRLKRNRKVAIIFLGSGSLVPTLFEIIIASLVISADSTKYQDSTAYFNTLVHIGTILVLISANILVVGAAIYGRIERRALRNLTTNRRSSSSMSNIELTRISTFPNNSLLTGADDGWEDSRENYFTQETRPIFRSLTGRRERDDIELSSARRMTV